MEDSKLIPDLEKCIQSLAYKFRKHPFNFFTESDAHSYLYYYIFRFGPKELKLSCPTQNTSIRTVLIHREYPTLFRYNKKDLKQNDIGSRGHYDLAVLDPVFVENHPIHEIIAKDYDDCDRDPITPPLLAAIEFKFLVRPLHGQMMREIECDFQKLSWALEKQATNAYMLIFNRSQAIGADQKESLLAFQAKNPGVKLLYAESVYSQHEKGRKIQKRWQMPESWEE